MKSIVKFFAIFVLIAFVTNLWVALTGIPFASENFWNHHGVLFLIFITLFPRLSLILSSVPFGGVMWWLGLIFTPRLLVAILATINYWNENPILVVLSWLVCLGGEASEKIIIKQQVIKVKPDVPTFVVESRRIQEEFDEDEV